MKYARFIYQNKPLQGIVQDSSIQLLEGNIFGDYRLLDQAIPVAEARLLAPVQPGKVLATAVNYHSHVAQSRAVLKEEEAPKQPELFYKPISSIIGPDEPIIWPSGYEGRVDAEGEMVAVIGKRCRNVS
ncbi:MAG TPA: fumarylacetoacetate hydrolase family protein, partial [Dehalococcoidia bacterium]|nr:fumarylacetoacetate hydrolase family protein [Dehalococcoidia bacterium]